MRWCKDTPQGQSVLLVRFGRALQRCTGPQVPRFAQAITSTVYNGCVEQLGNTRRMMRLEQVLVVIDCRGANSLMLAQHMSIVKQVAQALNRHFPARLSKVYLVEVPQLLRWALGVVLSVLSKSTQARVRVVGEGDKQLPIRLTGPDMRRLSTSSSIGSPTSFAASPMAAARRPSMAMQHATSLPVHSTARRPSALVEGPNSTPTTPAARARAPPGAGSASVPARHHRTRGAGSWTPFTPNLPPVDEPRDGALGGRCMSADNLQLLNAPTLPEDVSAASVFDMRVDAGGERGKTAGEGGKTAGGWGETAGEGGKHPGGGMPAQKGGISGTVMSGPAAAAAMQAMMVAMFVLWMYLAAVSQEFVNLVPVVT